MKAADKTRRALKRKIGSYADHLDALSNRQSAPPEMLERASRLGALSLQLQWVTGDSKKAEQSFFRINQEAVPIDPTELRLLKARSKPNAMAARAIIRAGGGHKYWSRFNSDHKDEIESIAKELNDALFSPELRTPIKTLDVPVAGKGYSARTLSLVFDLVNVSNGILDDSGLDDDVTGEGTVNCMRQTRKVLRTITGVHPASLGLHPIVYFYSATGRYQQTAFFGSIALMMHLADRKRFPWFIKHRANFERFLLANKTLINQLTLKHGSGLKGYKQVKDFFLFVLERMDESGKLDEVVQALQADPAYAFLDFNSKYADSENSSFSDTTKSAAFLRDAIKQPLSCQICGGLIHFNSIQVDHIQRKADGGLGTVSNAQLTHPYCNSTVKQ